MTGSAGGWPRAMVAGNCRCEPWCYRRGAPTSGEGVAVGRPRISRTLSPALANPWISVRIPPHANGGSWSLRVDGAPVIIHSASKRTGAGAAAFADYTGTQHIADLEHAILVSATAGRSARDLDVHIAGLRKPAHSAGVDIVDVINAEPVPCRPQDRAHVPQAGPTRHSRLPERRRSADRRRGPDPTRRVTWASAWSCE